MERRRRRALPAVVLLGLGLAALAHADYQSAYKKGLDAIQRRAWADAAREMRAALAERPKEGEQIKLYGMRFETYLPQYYLGLALFNSGDCAEALKAWSVSESQGAVKSRPEFKDLVRNRTTCQTRLASETRPTPTPTPAAPRVNPAEVAQAAQAAQAEIARADEAGRGLAALQGAADLASIWAQDSALGGAQRQGNEALADARNRLATGQRDSDLAALGAAKEAGIRARQLFEGVRSEAAARQQQAAQRRAAAATPATPTSLTLTPTKPTVPTELVDGTGSYFRAQYREAVETLSRAQSGDNRTNAQVLLLRSAARFALYQLSEEKDEALKQAALADARACQKLDPRTQPSPRVFSPRFVAFFAGRP